MKRRTHRVERAEDGRTLEELVGPLTGGEASPFIARGAVYVKGKRTTDPALRLREGDVVSVVLEERGRDVREPAVESAPWSVLFEDTAIIAVNKPAGLTAQPTPGGERSLLDVVRDHLQREPGLVHRLDRETSGVTVFGKSPLATSALAEQFREGTARKQYLAICGPALPESGSIDLPLSKDPSRPGRYRATRAANGVPAETEFKRLALFEDHALVALFPKTGRTHQLRAHLTALNAPICGDARYGGSPTVRGEPVSRCLLHAFVLQLSHPETGKSLTLVSPLPEDMAQIFAADGLPVATDELSSFVAGRAST